MPMTPPPTRQSTAPSHSQADSTPRVCGEAVAMKWTRPDTRHLAGTVGQQPFAPQPVKPKVGASGRPWGGLWAGGRWAAGLIGLAVLCSGVAQADAPGSFVLIGGGARAEPVMRRFVDLAGGPEALILIVPTASDLPDTGKRYLEEFCRLSCTRVQVLELKDRRQAETGKWAELMAQAGGVFFAGGDQRRIMQVCGGTPFAAALVEAHRRGMTIGGTAAGLASMGPFMLTGEGNLTSVRTDPRHLWPGFNLVPGVILDQHFQSRQRFNRLLAVVLTMPELVGVGVDEHTAVLIGPDREIEVLGEGSVVILDAREASVRQTAEGLFGAVGVSVRLLLPGDRYRLPEPVAATADPDR